MIEFIDDVKNHLPYSRKQYISFKNWFGVSYQLDEKLESVTLDSFVNNFESFIRFLITMFDKDTDWVVNHDDKDLDWFPNNEDNLYDLRKLFKENNIPNNFRGGLILTGHDLLTWIKSLMIYPFSVFNDKDILYKNLDISNCRYQFIIKISGHLNIDLLSTNKDFLEKIIFNDNYPHKFIVKEYRGTKLL